MTVLFFCLSPSPLETAFILLEMQNFYQGKVLAVAAQKR